MREKELERFPEDHPDLAAQVAEWRQDHPAGSLADAVTDLELWSKNPLDRDAQWFVWRCLYDMGDPVAKDAGFAAMRSAPARKDSSRTAGNKQRRTA